MGAVASLASLISAIVSFIGVYTWTASTTISSVDQPVQFVHNYIQIVVAFVLNWLQDSLISLPLGIVTYIATYLATLLREMYYYFSIF